MKIIVYLALALIGVPAAVLGFLRYIPVMEATARPYFTVACAGLKQLGHLTEARKRGGNIEQIDCGCMASEFDSRMGREQFARTMEKARIRTNDYLAWQLGGRVGQPASSVPVPDRDLDRAYSIGMDVIQEGKCY